MDLLFGSAQGSGLKQARLQAKTGIFDTQAVPSLQGFGKLGVWPAKIQQYHTPSHYGIQYFYGFEHRALWWIYFSVFAQGSELQTFNLSKDTRTVKQAEASWLICCSLHVPQQHRRPPPHKKNKQKVMSLPVCGRSECMLVDN